MSAPVRSILKYPQTHNKKNNTKKVNFTNETLKYIARLDANTRLVKYNSIYIEN